MRYIVNSEHESILISEVITEFNDRPGYMEELESSRDISSNVGHSGDIANMQHIRYKKIMGELKNSIFIVLNSKLCISIVLNSKNSQ